MKLDHLSVIRFFFSQLKKIILTLFFISVFVLLFEQLVSSAPFPLPVKNTTGINTGDSITSLKNEASIKAPLNSPAPDNPAMLPVLQVNTASDSQGTLTSTAGNFRSAWRASVDPRTGSTSFSLVIASVLYDAGLAKRDLILSYNGGHSAQGVDAFNLGSHWTFNIGTEHVSPYEVAGHRITDITTGGGYHFTMINDRNNQGKTIWHPLHHKLGDVAFTGAPGNWNVSMATDVREHIADGYAQWEQARDGRKMYFYYDRKNAGDHTRRLTYICGHRLTTAEQQGLHNACARNGIWITYSGPAITIHGDQEVTLHKGENGGISNISAITLPSLSSEGVSNHRKKAMIRFTYDDRGKRPWLLSRVNYPTGKSKTFLYNGESGHPGAQIKGLPIGIHGMHIPVVTEVITSSEGSGDTEPLTLREWYRYGEVNDHGQSHNYMGYQGAGSVVPGKDNLFDRPDDYTYSVSRDNGFTTTTTTYNKYHLPQLVEQRNNQEKNLLARSEQKYIPLKGTVFSRLPGNYSLPIGSSKILYAMTETGQDKTVMPAQVIQATRYNNNGQKLWEKDAYGRITMTQYCPQQGNEHCPAMDSQWPQITQPEKILIIPAPHSPEGSAPFLRMTATRDADPEPAMITVFDYMAFPATSHPEASENSLKIKTAMQGNINVNTSTDEHFWQVKTKTVGTLPLAAVAHLQPGDSLPEISQGKVSTRTTYRYNTQPGATAYGQLNQLNVIRYKAARPIVQGSILSINTTSHPATPEESITVNVYHKIDKIAQTRTMTMKLADIPATGKTVFKNTQSAENPNPENIEDINTKDTGVSLGTAVYSLTTGNKIASQDTLKEMQTIWHYDNWGRVIRREVIPASGGRAQTTSTRYIFTPEEKAVIQTLPGGQQFKTVSDAFNQVVSTWHRFSDQAGKRTGWIIDTQSTYTVTGKPATHTVYHADDPGADGTPGSTIGLTTTYGYDSLNRQVWKKTPDGIITVTVRNDPGMQLFEYQVSTSAGEALSPLLTVTECNILGKPVARYLLPFDPVFKKQNRALYPPALQNRLKKMVTSLQEVSALQTHNTYGLLSLSGSNGLFSFVKEALHEHTWLKRTLWEYDGNGRKVKQIQSNGAVTRWIYQQGNLVATIAPDGHIIHDTFNVYGKKVSRCVQPAGSSICHILGTRGFDIRGNMLWQADEYGQRLQYTRDNNGRMLSMKTPATDEAPEGHIFTYEYNSLGMTRASVDGQAYVTHRYDPDTWQLTDTNDAVSHLHYTYDKNTGALIKIVRNAPLKEAGIIPLAEINYPATIRLMLQDRYLKPLSTVDEAGNKYTSVHDRLGRVIQQKIESVYINQQKENIAPVAIKLISTVYDSLSRPAIITNNQGMQRLFSYDTAGKIASTTDTLNGKKLLQLSYTYDTDTDNILTLTREEGELTAVQSYTYDLQNNLSAFHCGTVNEGMNNNRKMRTMSLDLCPRDIDIKGSGLTGHPIIIDQQYTFDQWNNIHQIVESVIAGKGFVKKTTNYAYQTKGTTKHPYAYNPNRLLSYRSQWEGQAYSAPPATLTYDNAGRIIKDAAGNILHYNILGEQDRFTNAETQELTRYTYDSTGHQIAKQPFSAQNRPLQPPLYMFYSGHTIATKEQRDKNNLLHISAELAGVAHSEDGVITRWYLHNYKGDVLQSYNSQGHLLSNNVYSPYGMQYDRQNNTLTGIPKVLKNQSPWWQSHLPAFDGHISDEATGYQFLGGGYRAYNPIYRQFMTRDSFSPFKRINGYGFGDNNPVMNTDPTGHSPRWLGYTMGTLSIGMSLVLAILLPVVLAAITGVGMSSSTAISGIAWATAGTASGSLQIAATKYPQNMALQKTSISFTLAENIATAAVGTFLMEEGIIGAIDTADTMTRMTSSMLIVSGLSGAAAGITGSASSSMDEVMTFDNRLGAKSGLQSAVKYLGYLSTGLMATSIISGTGVKIRSSCVQAGIGIKTGKKIASVEKSMHAVPEDFNFTEEPDMTVGISGQQARRYFRMNMPGEDNVYAFQDIFYEKSQWVLTRTGAINMSEIELEYKGLTTGISNAEDLVKHLETAFEKMTGICSETATQQISRGLMEHQTRTAHSGDTSSSYAIAEKMYDQYQLADAYPSDFSMSQ